jgi:hypothetical protein
VHVKTLAIPPGDADYVIAPQLLARFPKPAYIANLRPHMHYRGSRVRAVARYPDGTSETLLSVTNYDFNWQHLYTLVPPKRVPAGTEVYVDGAFDNSRLNPANAEPEREVKWGMRTADEMFSFFLNFFDAD